MENNSKNLIDRKVLALRVPYSDVQIWRMEREGAGPNQQPGPETMSAQSISKFPD